MHDHHESVLFGALPEADLRVGSIYRSGDAGNVSDDPIAKLVGGGNSGGIRYEGSINPFAVNFIVLYTTLSDHDWPDYIDDTTGRVTYFGDNKTPWRDLHDTPRRGNQLLREVFHVTHLGDREKVPPILVFNRWKTSRDVVFRGLAVPSAPGVGENDDLLASWKTLGEERFINYRAVLTLLPVKVISRSSIIAAKEGQWLKTAPPEWVEWCRSGHRDELPLQAWHDESAILPGNPPVWLEEVMDAWDAKLGDWRAAYKQMPKSNNEMRSRAAIDDRVDSEWTSADHGLRGLSSALWSLADGVLDAGWQNFTAADLAIAALSRHLHALYSQMGSSAYREAEEEYCEAFERVTLLIRGITRSNALQTTERPID
jgi:hypothetical protein